MKKDIFAYIDDEERELMEMIKNSKTVPIPPEELAEIRRETILAAKNFKKKDKKINLRLNQHDYDEIKRVAAREGLPYQTLISSLITRYISGSLVPKHVLNN